MRHDSEIDGTYNIVSVTDFYLHGQALHLKLYHYGRKGHYPTNLTYLYTLRAKQVACPYSQTHTQIWNLDSYT